MHEKLSGSPYSTPGDSRKLCPRKGLVSRYHEEL